MTDVKQAHYEMVRGMPGLTSKNLPRAIFKADVPEQFVRALPAQSLYMALKHNGIESSSDLVEILTVEQVRLLLDFDLWERDAFSEENFWAWLALTDANNDLSILQKVLKSIDLKIVALMIARHLDVTIMQDQTELPPAPGQHTPDNGWTWIGIKTEDSTQHFLLARLMALIFETSPELFYQLISTQNVQTASGLEEESYQERCRRLAAEGIPTPADAFQINTPLAPIEARKMIEAGGRRQIIENIAIIEPLVYDGGSVQPLSSLLSQVGEINDFESELTLIMNAAITHWAIEFYDHDEVERLISRVKGALNIGLQIVSASTERTPLETYEAIGLTKLYRVGLHALFELRKRALAVPNSAIVEGAETRPAFSVLAGARSAFPEMPMFLRSDGSIDDSDHSQQTGHVSIEHKAIESLSEIEAIMGLLKREYG